MQRNKMIEENSRRGSFFTHITCFCIANRYTMYIVLRNSEGETMAKDRTQQRDDLHKTIWNIANDLRGSIDGWDFKQYVLGTLFYRYISENFTKYINDGEHEAGDKSFNYADIDDSLVDDATKTLSLTPRPVTSTSSGMSM